MILYHILKVHWRLKTPLTPDIKKKESIDNIESYIIQRTKSDTISNCNFEWWQSLTIKMKYDPRRDPSMVASSGCW